MARQIVTVFGGSGFLGRYVVQQLAASGAIVRACVRDAESALFLKPFGDPGQIVPMAVRITDVDDVERAVEGASSVVNLVGILAPWGKNTFQSAHVNGPRLIAEVCAAKGVERLVHISAIGADLQADSIYARTKAEGEQAVLEAFPAATIVRPSVVFGPEDKFFNLFGGLACIAPVLPLIGGGKTMFQPVYVNDVARAVAAILDIPATCGKTYELGGPKTYSFRSLMEYLLTEIRRERALISVPFALASFKAWFLEKIPEPLLTRDQVKLLRHDNVVSSGALSFAELGLEPTPLEAIVPGYVHRYRPPSRQGPRSQ